MITVFTFYTTNWWDLANVTVPIMKMYCDKHGYNFWSEIYKPKEKYDGVEKLQFIKDHFKDGQVFFVLDCDCLITNHNILVEGFLNDSHDFYVCKDINGINTGVFIFRCSEWSKSFLEYLFLQYGNDGIDCEQNCVDAYLAEFGAMDKIKIIKDGFRFNSYPMDFYAPSYGKIGYIDGEIVPKPTREQGSWEVGDFICHTPALPLPKRIEIFKHTTIIR